MTVIVNRWTQKLTLAW